MLIHGENIRYDARNDSWEYHISNIGFNNEAYIPFRSKQNDVPRTGDMVVNNWLVKKVEND